MGGKHQAPATPELVERLKDAAERFLKWTYDQPYSGSPVISIPRHPNNIDAILCEAADALEAQQARIAELEGRAEYDEEEARLLSEHANRLSAHHHLRDQHVREEQAFWNGLGVDPGDLSAALYAAYQAGEDGLAVLRRFSPSKPGRKLQGAGFRKDITRNMRGQIVRRRVEA